MAQGSPSSSDQQNNFPDITTVHDGYKASLNRQYTPTDLVAIYQKVDAGRPGDDMYLAAVRNFAITDRLDEIPALEQDFRPYLSHFTNFEYAIKYTAELLETNRDEKYRNPEAAKKLRERFLTAAPSGVGTKDLDDVAAGTQGDILKAQLSVENYRFLFGPKLRRNFSKNKELLERVGLADGMPTYAEAAAFLTDLHIKGLIDIDKLRTTLKEPVLAVAPVLTPDDAAKLKEQMELSAFSIDHPVFFEHSTNSKDGGATKKFHVMITEGATDKKLPYVPVDKDNPESPHYNDATNYDSSRAELTENKMTHLPPSGFFVLVNTVGEFEKNAFTMLDMGERGDSKHIPLGATTTFFKDPTQTEKPSWIANQWHFQDSYLRIRPTGGGIYSKEK